jgi:hypothetical protein
MKKGDLVVAKSCPNGPLGQVTRVARDGSWADVRCGAMFAGESHEWSKRMRTSALRVIEIGCSGFVLEPQ